MSAKGSHHSTNETSEMYQINGLITESEFYFALGTVVFVICYNGYNIYQKQQRLSFEYIQALHLSEYASSRKINFWEGLLTQNLYKYDENERTAGMLSVAEDKNIINQNGRSGDYGSSNHMNINKEDSVDPDLSKLSSLQSKVQHAIEDEELSSSTSDDDIKSPPNLKNDESIIYSLSTTYANSNQVASPQINIFHESNQQTLELEQIHFPNTSQVSDSNIYSQDLPKDTFQLSADSEHEHPEYDESDDHDSFNIFSLIATCKLLSEKAGDAITAIYSEIDIFDNVKYDETKSFKEIDQYWLNNQKMKNAGKNASERGKKSKKKKSKNKGKDYESSSVASSEIEGASSPFKQKLPSFIKDSNLFDLNPRDAARAISRAIITESLDMHFPELNCIKYALPNDYTQRSMRFDDILPTFINMHQCKRRKLLTENGNDIARELRLKMFDEFEEFNNLEEDDLILWMDAMEGSEAMSKRDRESLRSVTILIGIADANTNRPIAGIIYSPFTGETVIGLPSMLEVLPYNFTVSQVLHSKHHSKRIVINKYCHNDKVKTYLKQLRFKYDQLSLEGGMGNNVLLLMQNEADAILHPDADELHKWHTCAIEAVILALGGNFCQTDGKSYKYNAETTGCKRGFVATLHGKEYHEQFQYKLYFGR